MPSYGIGGTTVSVRNLVSLLAKADYNCWIMPLYPHGVLKNIYADVQCVQTPSVISALSAPSWQAGESFLERIYFATIRLLKNNFRGFERKVVGKALESVIKQNGFDVVVASQEGKTTRFVSYEDIVSKVAWVRCDYKRMMEDKRRSRENHYDGYQSIICVSEKTNNSFKSVFPEFIEKTYCIPNPQDSSMLIRQSEIKENDSRFIKNGKTIVSIGRLHAVKRFDQIAPIARTLKGKGLKFRWFLIGGGEEHKQIEATIKEYGVENEVIMLGVKVNPYYYIKHADVLVCLSYSEACPRVVNEAKILHTPTVSTDYPSIYEFINDGETGIISSLEEIPDAIMRLLTDDELLKRIKTNIGMFEFDNTVLIEQIKLLF